MTDKIAEGLRTSVVRNHGIWSVVLSGEVDLATVDELRAVLGDIHGLLLIDCSQLEFIDAEGLGVLVTVGSTNGTMTLRGTTPLLRKVLSIVGLAGFVALEERT